MNWEIQCSNQIRLFTLFMLSCSWLISTKVCRWESFDICIFPPEMQPHYKYPSSSLQYIASGRLEVLVRMPVTWPFPFLFSTFWEMMQELERLGHPDLRTASSSLLSNSWTNQFLSRILPAGAEKCSSLYLIQLLFSKIFGTILDCNIAPRFKIQFNCHSI